MVITKSSSISNANAFMKKATSQRYVHLVQTISLGKRKANSSFWTAGHKDYVGEVKHLILKDR